LAAGGTGRRVLNGRRSCAHADAHVDDRPLSHPVFRSLWLATTASHTGILIQSVGTSWLLVEAGASAQQVALVPTAASLPIVLLSPFAGAIADHVDRRLVMLSAQALLALVSVALALLAWQGQASAALVVACTFFAGCCLSFNGPAWMASIGDILPRAAIPGGVVCSALSLNIARAVGPALGGIVIAAAGEAANFGISAACSLLLMGTLLTWRRPVRPIAQGRPPLLSAVREGLVHAAATPAIRAALARTMLFGTVCSAVQALMPLIAHDLLGGGADTYGFLFTGFGGGALLGALISSRLRLRFRSDAVVQGCTALAAAAAIGTAFSRSAAVGFVFLALAGGVWVVAFSTFNVSVQLASSRGFAARTLSLYQMAAFGGVALGSWISGIAADQLGVSGGLLVSGGLALASMMIGALASWRMVGKHEPGQDAAASTVV
jgi:MFS family permease